MSSKLCVPTMHLCICLVMLLALGLRLYGVQHSYPYSFYPDEVHFVKRALSFGSFDFNPHWFHKPAFYMYVLFFEYGIYYLFGRVIGLWSTVSDFAAGYVKNPGPFYMIGRLTTVLFSVGSIWIVYRLGERYFKKGVGFVAALLLSLSYGHVAASQDIKADTPAMFFAILSMLFLLKHINRADRKKRKDMLWSAVFAGIGAATKIYPIVMLVPIIVSVILDQSDFKERVRIKVGSIIVWIGIILGIFYATYFVCSPYSFIGNSADQTLFSSISKKIMSSYTGLWEKIHVLLGGTKVERPSDFINQRTGLLQGFIEYVKVLVTEKGMGPAIGSISLLGCVYLLVQRKKQNFLFLLYPIIFPIISVIQHPGVVKTRYQLSLYPFLAITAGVMVVSLMGNRGLRQKVVIAVFFLLLIVPFYKIVKRGHDISKPDTRNIAKAWVESNIPSGSKLLINENGVQLLMSELYLKKLIQKAAVADPNGQFTAHYDTYLAYQLLAAKDAVTYDIHEIRMAWWRESEFQEGVHELTSDYDKDMGNPLKPVGVNSFKYYVDNDFQYVIVHSDEYKYFLEPYPKLAENPKLVENFPSFARFYRSLFEEGEIIKEFSMDDNLYGPTVKIFRIAGNKQ